MGSKGCLLPAEHMCEQAYGAGICSSCGGGGGGRNTGNNDT